MSFRQVSLQAKELELAPGQNLCRKCERLPPMIRAKPSTNSSPDEDGDSRTHNLEITARGGGGRAAAAAVAAGNDAQVDGDAILHVAATAGGGRHAPQGVGHYDDDLPEPLFPSQDYLLTQRSQLFDQLDAVQGKIDELSEPPQFSQQRQEARADHILSTQANQEAGLASLVLSVLRANRLPIRTRFSDHEYRLLVNILDNLITLINTVSSTNVQDKAKADLEFYYVMFTAFPAIYCSFRRGGKKDSTTYVNFLRKRSENKNFYQHALWYVRKNDPDHPLAGPEGDAVPASDEEAPNATFQPQPLSGETMKRRVEMLARKGKASKALDALEPGKIAPTSCPDVMATINSLHASPPAGVDYGDTKKFCPRDPDGKPVHDYFTKNKGNHVNVIYTKQDILMAMRSMKRHAAPGLSGWTLELFSPLLKDSTAAVKDFITEYLNKYISLDLPHLSQHFSSNSFLFAIWKNEAAKTVRPLAIPCFLNKLAWKLGLSRTKGNPTALVDCYGLFRRNGCQTIARGMQTALHDGKICLQVDVSNAFNNLCRSKFLNQVYADQRYKNVWSLVHLDYQHPADLVTAEGNFITCHEGIFQGSTASSFAFSLATCDLQKTLQRLRPNDDHSQKAFALYIDDTNIILQPTPENIANIETIIDDLGRALAEYGLKMNPAKTKIWCPPSVKLPLSPIYLPYLVKTEAKCLGGIVAIDRDNPPCELIASMITDKLAAYDKLDTCDVNLHLQHYIFQASTIPAIDFLLGNSWCLYLPKHFDAIFKSILQWYAAKFLGAASGEGLNLDKASGLITQAQLEKPAGASGGGLGVPSFTTLRIKRNSILETPQWRTPFAPSREWNQSFYDHLNDGQYEPTEEYESEGTTKFSALKKPTSSQLAIHWWHHYVMDQLYPYGDGRDTAINHRRAHLKAHKSWTDTRWLRIPPERYSHTIHAATFKATLAAIAFYAPNFKLPENCISKTLPTRQECLTQADYMDHILHCSGCVGPVLVRKHNSVNYAIQKILSEYHLGYSVEPNGLPRTEAPVGGKRKYCGPDGCLTTDEGLTVVEIHCSHPRLWASPKSSNTNTVQVARNNKVSDYKNFEAKYPGTKVQIFTVSTGGVIHPDTIDFIKTTWLPMARDSGRGLIRALTVEIWFAIARSVGSAVQMATIRK